RRNDLVDCGHLHSPVRLFVKLPCKSNAGNAMTEREAVLDGHIVIARKRSERAYDRDDIAFLARVTRPGRGRGAYRFDRIDPGRDGHRQRIDCPPDPRLERPGATAPSSK